VVEIERGGRSRRQAALTEKEGKRRRGKGSFTSIHRKEGKVFTSQKSLKNTQKILARKRLGPIYSAAQKTRKRGGPPILREEREELGALTGKGENTFRGRKTI